MDKEESIRLHTDWWGKCRTCKHWDGKSDEKHVRWLPAICENQKSDLFGQETWTEGHCPQWDSFDIDIALELLGNDEKH